MMELSKLVEDGEGASDDNFWSQIMAECQANCHSTKLPSSKSLLVLGDDDAQKAQLVAKLQGSGEGKGLRKGNGLQYHFLTVRDEYCEHQTRLDVWVLDEDPAFKDLLKHALDGRTLPDTTVLLTASMARPWDILRCVELWSGVLDEHIRGCGVDGRVLQERRAAVLKRYREYAEPTASIYGPLDDQGVVSSDQIEHNLGVEIIVVVTQTEHMTALQSEFGFVEEHFDFIQLALRRFCMSRGAALLYVSVKEDRNCDVLLKYVLHKIYALPFRIPAMFLEKDSIFVPAGWDSESKVLALAESSLATIAAGQPFEEVIARPGRLAEDKKPALEVEAQRDQDFLAAILPAVTRPLPENNNNNNAASTNGADVSGVVSSRNPTRRAPRAPRSPQKKQLESKLASGEGDTVLQSFFKSLLKRQTSAPAERPRNYPATIPPEEQQQQQQKPTLGCRRLGASVDSPSLAEDDELNGRCKQDAFTEFMSKYRAQHPEEDPLEDDVNPLPEYFLSSGGGGHCCGPNGGGDPLEDTLDRVKSEYNPPLRLLLEEKQAFQNDIRQSGLKVNCVAVASSDGEKAEKSAGDAASSTPQPEKTDDQ